MAEDFKKIEIIMELTTLLNELDANGEVVTLHEGFDMGDEKKMVILAENFHVCWDQSRNRWKWSRDGRKELGI